jgi:UDP-glucose:(heptosyl)LPS alpha-1,3-glucosyltransferase
LWRDRSFAKAACRELAKPDYGLVQSHERIPCCDLYRAGDGVHREWLQQRARLRGSRSGFLTRLSPYHRYLLDAEKRLFQSERLKIVICNSQMVATEIQTHFGLPAERLRVIHNGVDTDRFHPGLKNQYRTCCRDQWGIAEEVPLFLFLGSGFERKGLGASLSALARLPAPAHLLIVGKDRHTKHYRKEAQRLGISQRVTFAGAQSDPRPFYAAADAFLLPTLYDPFPNVCLEAMACGLPIITSSKSGTQDILRQGENGYVLDALDISALADTLSALLEPTLRTSIGQAARKTVEPMSFERMADEYLALYEGLIESSGSESIRQGADI